ncbi:aminopeptidase N [Oceanicella actignis]|uniref:aminopeptidase N n=1 Tax=Oceanicella actignis TaxID=1189325 RepID=UPI0011E7E476|nr:aminopeptidase N [Oceanicella actignis]TYO91510.1 aminopeptidase N [Oceanicella actignis]
MPADRRDDTPKAPLIRLADYRPPAWLVETTDLTFDLHPDATRVRARIDFTRNPDGPGGPLRLDGRGLRLLRASVNGEDVTDRLTLDAEGLTLDAPLPDAFVWECETVIAPAANTALEGLYLSNGMYCTQCEAQGFRKITYYPDRPDVMAVFSVRIEAPAELGTLLSNGEPGESGPLPGGRRYACWRDPWPKPSYLFALVAGDLRAVSDAFVTASGRKVALNVWVRPGDEDRCAYALDALKRAMRWDEEKYGREYDLSVFNIVAVDDFNMGAMENKGLNIFNSKYVLASPQTATDRDYELIESIVAHEYFHNWTGNRITCRDWFQLCLKEGLTVFRDQEFTADQRSAAVKRIEDVRQLRARQFREDAGPLAHPVRPDSYREINNFYTATVYEKGAEVIRMLRLLVGEETWRKGMDLYFERHDGQACAVEDWLKVFEDVSGRDLSQFKLWYEQAGTPRLRVREEWDGRALTLTLSQRVPPTPGQPDKKPMVIPVACGFLGQSGDEIAPRRLFELTEAEQSWRIELPERPTLSLLRGFSAPVILERDADPAERAFLLAHDSDPFNRWQAGAALAAEAIAAQTALRDGVPTLTPAPIAPGVVEALGKALRDETLDPAFRALILAPPSEDEIAQALFDRDGVVDPQVVHAARERWKDALTDALADDLAALRALHRPVGPYSPEAADAGRRALANGALALLARRPQGQADAAAQFAAADNMTDKLAALTALTHNGAPQADEALEAFRRQWAHDPLVMDKWRMIQATSPQPDAFARVKALSEAEDFQWRNPNRLRSLVGAFAMANPARFHAADGAPYRFYADWLLRMDKVNPQTAARMAGAFETWRRLDAGRQALARAQLQRIAAEPGLSRDLSEMVERMLDG